MIALIKKAAYLPLAIFLLPTLANAFQFSPMSVSIDPSEKNASTTFAVNNKSDSKIAVQISMAKRIVDEAGNETQPEDEDDFIIYPPQMILGPNEQRNIRLTWVGTQKPDRELSYRIIAEQLPVDVDKNKSKKKGIAMVNVLVKYVGAVYITPKDVNPEVVITDSSLIEKSKQPFLKIVIENKGTKHLVLNGLRLHIRSAQKDSSPSIYTIESKDLKGIAGENILSKSKRVFQNPWPNSLPKGPVKVDFDLKG